MLRPAQIITALTAPPHLELQGVAGPARGAAIQLPPGAHALAGEPCEGEGANACFVIAGAAGARVSARVSRLRRAALTLEAGEAQINHAPMTIGAPVVVARSVLLSLGASTFKVAPRHSGARRYGGPATLAAALIAATALPTRDAPPVLAAAPAAVFPSAPQFNPDVVTRAAAALRQQLAASGLEDVTVSTAPEAGVVTARAPERLRDSAEWIAVREWFDHTWGARTALDARFANPAPALSLPFAIRSAWSAPRPIVVLHDGRRYGLGDALPGGWTLMDIGSDSASVRRADQIIDIKF